MLHQRLAVADQGRGGGVWVAGEPGIGKTRLLMERLIEIVDLAPGEYAYHCKLFGHAPTMKEMLVVQ